MLQLYIIYPGSVLDDEELIEALKQVKRVASEVKGRLEKAQRTEKEIMSSREKYLPVCCITPTNTMLPKTSMLMYHPC